MKQQIPLRRSGKNANPPQHVEMALYCMPRMGTVFYHMCIDGALVAAHAEGGAGNPGGKSPAVALGEVDDHVIALRAHMLQEGKLAGDFFEKRELLPTPVIEDKTRDGGVPLEHRQGISIEESVDLGMGHCPLEMRKQGGGEQHIAVMAHLDHQDSSH